jgi:hypothetical protein
MQLLRKPSPANATSHTITATEPRFVTGNERTGDSYSHSTFS